MAIKVYGNKIVFPDSTEQTTAPTQLDGYDKAEMDAQQKAQDDKIQANTDAIEVNTDELSDKVSEAPTDGKPYARKNKGWHEVEAGTGDVEEAPKDGKTYGRKNEAWTEVVTDSYTKAEIDNQQAIQDGAIADNTTDIATNTADIAENKTNIQQNTTDIESLIDDIDALTGSVIYKGSLNATVTPAPLDAVVGDMYINEYNVSEPATNYPVASGWTPVTEVKYDDKLIKTDAGWDKIESVVGVPSYTAGEIDALLDDKADKGDSYLKAEADTLLNEKADKNTTYTKAESDAKNDAQDSAIQLNTEAISALPTPVDTYTKDEIDGLQIVQDDKIQANADAIADLPEPVDAYTKAESDATNQAQDALIQANTEAIDALPSADDYYNKDEIDNQQTTQNIEIAKKQDTGVSYTKTESDTLLDAKADKSTTYTKAEVDASQATQDTEIAKKANQATTYTKTEVDSSQALQNTEIAKKADKATTYTKDEVDELLESASGAIVGNYTNKHASGGVARDPLAGNLYLSNGMSFSTDYNAVTSIYISDTDGDGEVRDFDEVQVADKVTLTSEDGSGEYTIVTISDVGGYRELVVSTDSATGTIANDTPVSIVLDVASSGETGGGIEEAPSDGKQYGRQDEAWTEVNAGGTVADGCIYLNNQTVENDYTIPVGKNGMSAGAIEFKGTVTVPDGSKYHVVDESGDSIWTEEDGKAVYDGDVEARGSAGRFCGSTNNDVNTSKSGRFFSRAYSGDYSSGLYLRSQTNDKNELLLGGGSSGAEPATDIKFFTGTAGSKGEGVERMSIFSDGAISMGLTETTGAPNMHINATSGRIFRSTATMYTAEEVDKKLAIKDKIIEKLEARLTKLEARIK